MSSSASSVPAPIPLSSQNSVSNQTGYSRQTPPATPSKKGSNPNKVVAKQDSSTSVSAKGDTTKKKESEIKKDPLTKKDHAILDALYDDILNQQLQMIRAKVRKHFSVPDVNQNAGKDQGQKDQSLGSSATQGPTSTVSTGESTIKIPESTETAKDDEIPEKIVARSPESLRSPPVSRTNSKPFQRKTDIIAEIQQFKKNSIQIKQDLVEMSLRLKKSEEAESDGNDPAAAGLFINETVYNGTAEEEALDSLASQTMSKIVGAMHKKLVTRLHEEFVVGLPKTTGVIDKNFPAPPEFAPPVAPALPPTLADSKASGPGLGVSATPDSITKSSPKRGDSQTSRLNQSGNVGSSSPKFSPSQRTSQRNSQNSQTPGSHAASQGSQGGLDFSVGITNGGSGTPSGNGNMNGNPMSGSQKRNFELNKSGTPNGKAAQGKKKAKAPSSSAAAPKTWAAPAGTKFQ